MIQLNPVPVFGAKNSPKFPYKWYIISVQMSRKSVFESMGTGFFRGTQRRFPYKFIENTF